MEQMSQKSWKQGNKQHSKSENVCTKQSWQHFQDEDSHNRPLSRSRCMFSPAPSWPYVWISLWKQVAVTPTSSPAFSLKAAEKEKLPSPTSSTSRFLDISGEIHMNNPALGGEQNFSIHFERALRRPVDYRAWTDCRAPGRTQCGINIRLHVTMTLWHLSRYSLESN